MYSVERMYGMGSHSRKATVFGVSFGVALAAYLALVAGHGMEHLIQLWQAFVLEWPRAQSMGVLGIYFPGLMRNETLHFAYNGAQWVGLLILLSGFRGRARTWWKAAIALQTWHFFEHVVLLAQYWSGVYLFGAMRQTSFGELLVPRIELHFIYVTLAVVPTFIAVYYYLRDLRA